MRATAKLLGVVAVAVAALILTPLFGAEWIPPSAIFGEGLDSRVFWQIRVPRTLTAFLAGSALALSGMALQAMFRNPLATESTLGVAGGATVGAALYVRLGLQVSVLGVAGLSVFAFVGALAAILVIYGLSRLRREFTTSTLLLAGVALSFFFSALVLLMQSRNDLFDSFRLMRWMMGSVSSVGFQDPLRLLPFVILGGAALLWLRRELDLLSMGEEISTGRGVDVKRVKGAIVGVTSALVGAVVAACGPIGFVGLIVPHVCRLLVGPSHRQLTVATVLGGGAFLAISDAAARSVIAPAELPVGALTALLGGPFFLWLLLTGKRVVG